MKLAFVYAENVGPGDVELWRLVPRPGPEAPYPIPSRLASLQDETYTGPEPRPGMTRLEDGRELTLVWEE